MLTYLLTLLGLKPAPAPTQPTPARYLRATISQEELPAYYWCKGRGR